MSTETCGMGYPGCDCDVYADGTVSSYCECHDVWPEAVERSWAIGTGFPEAFAEISAEWVWEPADLAFYRLPL